MFLQLSVIFRNFQKNCMYLKIKAVKITITLKESFGVFYYFHGNSNLSEDVIQDLPSNLIIGFLEVYKKL